MLARTIMERKELKNWYLFLIEVKNDLAPVLATLASFIQSGSSLESSLDMFYWLHVELVGQSSRLF